jgi:hypothetical protein
VKFFQAAKWGVKEDFGKEWYVKFFATDVWVFLQASVSWNDYASSPYFHLSMGNGRLLGIVFWAYKFGFDIDVLSRNWDVSYMGAEE